MARNSNGRRVRHTDFLDNGLVAEYTGSGLLPGQSAGGGGGVGAYLLSRAMPHLPPWLAAAGIGITGGLGSLKWEESAAAGVGLTLASVALTGATWWMGKSTTAQRRLHSAITVASASAWTTAACLAGPTAGPLPDLYLMGAPALALSWNIRMILRRNDAPTTESGDKGLLEKVGLARAQIGNAKVEPNRVTAPLAVEAGEQTNDDVSKALARIASALDLPTSAVRYQPDPDSSRRGELVIVPEDMLAEAAYWEGPSNLGGSIADPLVIGRYDDGSPMYLWLPGDPDAGRNGTHVLIAGGTGSGKGETALNLQTEILSRRDVLLWLSDPKMFQDFRPLLPGIDWAAEGGTPTEVMVEAIQAVIPARTRWLVPAAAQVQKDAKHSCRADGRACGCAGMPYLVAWMEEAASTLRNLGDDAFTGIAQEARSAGVSLIVSLQRPSYDQVSTSTRASLPSVIALGCDPRDESFSLPDTVLDAGAHPGAWGNRRPGYCYLVTPGIDETRYASPGRTWGFGPNAVSLMEVLADWAQRNGATADPITAGAASSVAGNAYSGRPTSGDTPRVTPPPTRTTWTTPGTGRWSTPRMRTSTPKLNSRSRSRAMTPRSSARRAAASRRRRRPAAYLTRRWRSSSGTGTWSSVPRTSPTGATRLVATNATGRWRIVPTLMAA
jgi:hypothetical protein